MMPYDVIEARHVTGFVLWLRFRDGTAGEIDLGPELHGPIFEPLRDPVVFEAKSIQSFRLLCGPTARTSRRSSCTRTYGSGPNLAMGPTGRLRGCAPRLIANR